MSSPTLTQPQARRIALAAQGFADPLPPSGRVTMRQVQRVIDRVQVVQVDSVNVLTRSHYLPFFSRLGSYPQRLVDQAQNGRRLVEYWAHEASLTPLSTWPLLAFRMDRFASRDRVPREYPELLEAVRQHLIGQPPRTSREVEALLPHGSQRPGSHWGWNWSAVKECLEYLFRTGQLTSAGRTASFERRYADPVTVLGPELVAARDAALLADPQESVTELIRISLRAHGLGSQRCLADYFRLTGPAVSTALQRLEKSGQAERVQVQGWNRPVWLDPGARRPRKVAGRAALLSPFDSLIWQRERTEALWGMRYRLEIYTPAAKRRYGYYVLPFLVDEELAGRVDLKADRHAGLLRATAHWEAGTDVRHARTALNAELEKIVRWLGLKAVDSAA